MASAFTHKFLSDDLAEVTFPSGEVLYSPCVPAWEQEVAHNHRLVVREDQHRARELLRPGRQVLDVGANVGRLTVLTCWLGAHATAMEPIPDNAKCLQTRC